MTCCRRHWAGDGPTTQWTHQRVLLGTAPRRAQIRPVKGRINHLVAHAAIRTRTSRLDTQYPQRHSPSSLSCETSRTVNGEGAVWDQIDSLLDYLGRDVPPEVRVLKLAEETGEAAQALIGMNGWNPCKGVSATPDELLDELADVMLTAAVAMAGITQDARAAGEDLPEAASDCSCPRWARRPSEHDAALDSLRDRPVSRIRGPAHRPHQVRRIRECRLLQQLDDAELVMAIHRG